MDVGDGRIPTGSRYGHEWWVLVRKGTVVPPNIPCVEAKIEPIGIGCDWLNEDIQLSLLSVVRVKWVEASVK